MILIIIEGAALPGMPVRALSANSGIDYEDIWACLACGSSWRDDFSYDAVGQSAADSQRRRTAWNLNTYTKIKIIISTVNNKVTNESIVVLTLYLQTEERKIRNYGAQSISSFQAVLRIRICRIYMYFGLAVPDPLVRDTDPDPSIIKQK